MNSEMSPQPVLEQLWAALLVVCESRPHVPGVSGFPWVTLRCTAVVAFIVSSGHSLRRDGGLLKRERAQEEAAGKVRRGQDQRHKRGALTSPVWAAGRLPLQTLALAALSENLSCAPAEGNSEKPACEPFLTD